MGKESEDKAERILSMYARLKQGKIIYKEKESKKYEVSPRTIQRDIADIQCFLQNQHVETGELQEIVFDKQSGGYVLQTKNKKQLGGKEVLAVTKVLLDSRALVKGEMFPIIHKLLESCSDDEESKLVEDMLRNEMYHFVELQHGEQLLERIWSLEQAIKNQKFIEVQYRKLKKQELVKRKLKPVGIIFSEYYFYLVAFIEDIDKEKAFQNPDDIFPTIYRVDRLQNIQFLNEYFVVPYKERFEEGEFRKRIQFMYGGELRQVRLQCGEESVEAVLDKLPTAKILSEKDGIYTISAEVFGKGIDMWLKGQGEKVVKMA